MKTIYKVIGGPYDGEHELRQSEDSLTIEDVARILHGLTKGIVGKGVQIPSPLAVEKLKNDEPIRALQYYYVTERTDSESETIITVRHGQKQELPIARVVEELPNPEHYVDGYPIVLKAGAKVSMYANRKSDSGAEWQEVQPPIDIDELIKRKKDGE